MTVNVSRLVPLAALAAAFALAGCGEQKAADGGASSTAPAAQPSTVVIGGETEPTPMPSAAAAEIAADAKEQTAKVTVTNAGYEPAALSLKADVPAKLTFVRTGESRCGEEVVFPEYSIKKTLPLNEPVEVTFTPKKTGKVDFTCGMNMMKGSLVVQ